MKFPLLSANTYLRGSLKDLNSGASVEVASNSCAAPSKVVIDWKKAQRPSFLKPYLIRDFGGMRVALIGLDHPSTASMTTAVNVSDLCFRSPVETYREIRDEIGQRADIFIVLIHSANSPGKPELTEFVKAIKKDQDPRLDAIIAGHTHMIQRDVVEDVPIIQSGSGGERFGRIDFTFDLASKKIIPSKTRVFSGVPLLHQRCGESIQELCKNSSGQVAYDDVAVEQNKKVIELISAAGEKIKDLANQKLFVAKTILKRDRIRESPVANLLTDLLRQSSAADIAFLNTGGIRAEIPAGEITYEQFFEVLPFGNHGVVAGPMGTQQLVQLLGRSIRTCGDYGALMQSGLRVRFSRSCRGGGFDAKARLLTVETLDGEQIYDYAQGGVVLDRTFTVSTLDFLLDGGSGYVGFKGTPMIRDLGIVREVMASHLLQSPSLVEVDDRLDRRWFEVFTRRKEPSSDPVPGPGTGEDL